MVGRDVTCVCVQYTIRVNNRDQVAAKLKEQGITAAIHYPIPLHAQVAYKEYPMAPGDLLVLDSVAIDH